MKCQNCGKKEVSFHYSSNVNGAVTETRLCSECAAQSGYDSMFDFGSMFGDMFPTRSQLSRFGGINGFMPMAISVMSADTIMPFRIRPRMSTDVQNQSDRQSCGCCTETKENVEVDEKMSKLRELNAQMRVAVEKEDFENAAKIRDMIKELKDSKEGETNEVR